MITALQELINHISVCQNDNFISDIEYLKEKANDLLVKEKEQLLSAYKLGGKEILNDSSWHNEVFFESAENFYLTNYTTNLNVDEIANDRL